VDATEATLLSPMLTVAAVARRLGVAPPTLRTWDRRYGLGPSAHTAGAHRRYSPADVARLMVMRRLTLEGVPSADAAAIAIATAGPGEARDMHTPAEGYELSAIARDAQNSAVAPTRFDSLQEARRISAARDAPVAAEDDLDRDEVGVDLDRRLEREGDDRAQPGLDDLEAVDLSLGLTGLTAVAEGSSARSDWVEDHDGPDLDLDAWPEEDASGEAGPAAAWPTMLRSVATEESGASGGGRSMALPDGPPQSRELARAAMSLDTHEAYRLMRDAIRRQGVVPTWNTMIMPVLRALGERSRVSGDGIDVEHALSEAILGIIEESKELMEEAEDADTRDAAMIAAACFMSSAWIRS